MTVSGIYVISQVGTNRCYIGSSAAIRQRLYCHRKLLNQGKHHSHFLQNAWNKHGAEAFEFSVIEECAPELLLAIEQRYIDAFNPEFNVCKTAGSRRGVPQSPAARAKIRAFRRALTDLITHCPKGHAYDDGNTYLSSKNQRICRACNAARVALVYATETPEQRQIRMARLSEYAKTEKSTQARAKYAASHRAEKKLYDSTRRSQINARRAARRAIETPERRAIRLEAKRQSYLRHRDVNLVKMRAAHFRRRGRQPLKENF